MIIMSAKNNTHRMNFKLLKDAKQELSPKILSQAVLYASFQLHKYTCVCICYVSYSRKKGKSSVKSPLEHSLNSAQIGKIKQNQK